MPLRLDRRCRVDVDRGDAGLDAQVDQGARAGDRDLADTRVAEAVVALVAAVAAETVAERHVTRTRGSRTPYITSATRLKNTTIAPVTNIQGRMIAVSPLLSASSSNVPIPGREKTFSVTISPPNSAPTSSA